ncbi:hypothetical protein MMC26_007060 [Xylographa opegraphella]|nr:hypothetical protein [Xylographa opegraphella]
MSLDAHASQRAISPISPGRSSPALPRAKNRDDDRLVKKDKNYRRYASGIERVLSSFETTVDEWADYISFLGRLLKAIQNKPSDTNIIPHKALISKRLSQCLNPLLPSGVHQKTLDVYTHIFNSLGKEGLSTNLSLYLPGLMPVLSFAALSVKPTALALFETYVVALDPEYLRPALKAIILALLPCLEEESTEEFDRTLQILAALKDALGEEHQNSAFNADASGAQYFWQCMFLASITSKSRRPGALAYLARKFPLLGHSLDAKSLEYPQNGDHSLPAGQSGLDTAIDTVASPEPGLLIRCFCAGLCDEQLLTQRGFLELLVTHLPLHSVALQEKVVAEDLERLISAATAVVSRRDMSLNRRLWSWFLGPDIASENSSGTAMTPGQEGLTHHTRYFEKYGLESLVRTMLRAIDENSDDPLEKARPLRICLSLMDRWEVGGLVVPRIFLPAMKSVWQYQNIGVSSDSVAEVLRSSNMFFDGVESAMIWTAIIKVIGKAFDLQDKNLDAALDELKLVYFMVTTFNVREEEMLMVHMPIASLVIFLRIKALLRVSPRQNNDHHSDIIILALKIANRLLDLVPSRAFLPERASEAQIKPHEHGEDPLHDNTTISKIDRFYTLNQGNVDFEGQPLSPKQIAKILRENILEVVGSMLQTGSSATHVEIDAAVVSLSYIIRKTPNLEEPDRRAFSSALLGSSSREVPIQQIDLQFPLMAGKVSTLEIILSTPNSRTWLPESLIRQLIPKLVMGLWPSLSPSRPKYNVEAARCIWRLQTISNDAKLIESTISTLLMSHESQDEMNPIDGEDARRFATLWIHSPNTSTSHQSRRSSLVRGGNESGIDVGSVADLSFLERPLLLLLDVLALPKNNVFDFVIEWLQSLPSINSIVGMLIDRVSAVPTLLLLQSASADESDKSERIPDRLLDQGNDSEVCLYYCQLIMRIMEYSPNNAWPALSATSASEGHDLDHSSNAIILARVCLKLLQRRLVGSDIYNAAEMRLNQAVLSLLKNFLEGPSSALLVELQIEEILLDELISSIELARHSLQIPLMEIILLAMKLRLSSVEYAGMVKRHRPISRDTLKGSTSFSISTDADDRKIPRTPRPAVAVMPIKLLHCLTLGLTSRSSRPVLNGWITFLGACLPLYGDNIFQILIPLVECFCNTLGAAFKNVQSTFGKPQEEDTDNFEPTLGLLLDGLEQSLATAHDRLIIDESGSTPVKSPEQQQQSFFGTMVSGVFSSETNRARSTTANNRLTVLLCFKDAVRVCFTIWSWGDYGTNSPLQDSAASASFNYTILRLRNRTRRIFEHLFAAEALECLETLIELWLSLTKEVKTVRSATIFDLLHVLEGSRPKNAIPAIFNAIYSRTNPSALDPVRKSTLTSNLADTSLATFLVAYAKSLDDDAMDEIWNDCMTFLKDVLANPMPHRQTLPKLLEFTAVLGEKVDNTNFGEQRKMRRELGVSQHCPVLTTPELTIQDLFVRLLTATLTIRPIGFSLESSPTSNQDKFNTDAVSIRASLENRNSTGSDSLVSVLAVIIPNLSKVLVDADRIVSTCLTVSTQVIGPTFRSRTFPENISQRMLDLMILLSNIPEAAKAWKKDVSEAFNDTKFFSTSLSLAQHGWLPIIRQWAFADKERMPELLARLTTPTSAGIMFGVGANSARLDADRKAQLNLRRIAFVILSAANDTFVVNMTALQEKLVDLLNTTAASSPSSTTRAEIYMLIRALLLKISAHHLAPMWPTINSELYEVISSVFPDPTTEAPNITSLLQACKLLDTLLTLGLDDFQMQEWLFITDTTEAVYRSTGSKSVAMVDELAEELDSGAGASHFINASLTNAPQGEKRRPLLTAIVTKGVVKEDMMEKVLRPFFRQLSIYAFESTYSMEAPDWKACFDDLMADLFDDSTLV